MHGVQPAQARVGPKKDFLPSLNGGRGIAAFMVFGGHYLAMQFATPVGTAGRYVNGAPRGATDNFFFHFFEAFFPVPINYFFMLSGFVLAWIYRPGTSATGFWLRRFGRIYPAYFISSAVAFVLFGVISNFWTPWKVVLVHIFVLQAWTPDQRYNLGLNAVMWTLSAEAFNYLLFPGLMLIFYQMSKRALHVVAGCCIFMAFLLPIMANKTFDMHQPAPPVQAPLEGFPNQFAIWFTTMFPPLRLFQFILGITLALLLRRGVRWFAPNMPVAVAIFAGGLWFTNSYLSLELRYVAGMLVPLAVLTAAMAKADLTGKPTLLRSRPVQFLGKVSYAFYAVHILFILFTVIYPAAASGATDRPRVWLYEAGFLDHPTDAVPGWMNIVLFLIYLAASLFTAWLVHKFIEQPISRLIRERINRAKPPQPPAEAPALAVPSTDSDPNRHVSTADAPADPVAG